MIRAAAILLGSGVLCSACMPEYPGEAVGTFAVTGTLQDNTCGSQAVAVHDPLTFRVEVRREGARAWWRRPAAPLVDGSVQPDGTYRFPFRSRTTILEPDPEAQRPGCAVEQVEAVELRMTATEGDAGAPDAALADGGAAPSGFEGTQVIDLVPVAGSDCSEVLVAGGGPFATLPCRIEYGLRGEPTASF